MAKVLYAGCNIDPLYLLSRDTIMTVLSKKTKEVMDTFLAALRGIRCCSNNLQICQEWSITLSGEKMKIRKDHTKGRKRAADILGVKGKESKEYKTYPRNSTLALFQYVPTHLLQSLLCIWISQPFVCLFPSLLGLCVCPHIKAKG